MPDIVGSRIRLALFNWIKTKWRKYAAVELSRHWRVLGRGGALVATVMFSRGL